MEIQLKVPPTFRRPDLQGVTIQVEDGKTVEQFIDTVDICRYVVQFVLINNEKSPMDQQLKDGDIVTIVPMLAGG